ncbi:MAG: PEP-CTERM sorting domain-containing protein [Tepidisphaeraceae bacterium]
MSPLRCLDTSFATGENDDGTTASSNPNATGETRIGSLAKFSGKTSGSQGVRPTIQNSRMGFSHLSSSDAIPNAKNGVSRPVRVLDYRDDDNDLADGSNNALPAELRNFAAYADPITGTDASLDIHNGFTRLSAKSIIEGSYESRTNQTYVTVKAPNAAFSGDNAAQWKARLDTATGIKGDNSGNDVLDFRENIFQSVANFPAASVGNPADQLLALSFMLPQLVKFSKAIDSLNQDVANPTYNAGLSTTFLGSATFTAPFNPDAPNTITTGTSSKYGNSNVGNGSGTPAAGDIIINNGNWLFGDFDQRPTNQGAGISGKGYRDFSDLSVAQAAQAALQASGLGNDWNAGSTSNTTVGGLPSELVQGSLWGNAGAGATPTKGDLIVLGDFNADGKFDGQDVYRMARGTAVATGTGTTTLGSNGEAFADAVRHGVLRKNAALDLMDSVTTSTQKQQATASLANDPTGANAFKKEDVNRDGLIDLKDGKLVDFYCGKDYRILQHQLDAVQGGDGDSPLYTGSAVRKPISLVDVELNDTGKIDTFDFGVVRTALGSQLNDGDTDFNGVINLDDYAGIDAGFLLQNSPGWEDCWSMGDFDSNATVDLDDYSLIDGSFISQRSGGLARYSGFGGLISPEGGPESMIAYHTSLWGDEYVDSLNDVMTTYMATVPEPTAAFAVVIGAGLLLGRRRAS